MRMKREQKPSADPDNPYQALARTIIKTAADDYRDALSTLHRSPHNKEAQETKEEIERFFRSRWFGILSTVNPEYLIRLLNEEVKRK